MTAAARRICREGEWAILLTIIDGGGTLQQKRRICPRSIPGRFSRLSVLTGVMDPELGRELVSLSRIRNVKQRDVLPTFQKRRGTFLQLFLQSS
jgi:hypothetical protein